MRVRVPPAARHVTVAQLVEALGSGPRSASSSLAGDTNSVCVSIDVERFATHADEGAVLVELGRLVLALRAGDRAISSLIGAQEPDGEHGTERPNVEWSASHQFFTLARRRRARSAAPRRPSITPAASASRLCRVSSTIERAATAWHSPRTCSSSRRAAACAATSSSTISRHEPTMATRPPSRKASTKKRPSDRGAIRV